MVNIIEKAQAIADAEYSSLYFDAREEGKAEGIAEGILQVARAMLHRGDTPQEVMVVTGLSLEQVQQL